MISKKIFYIVVGILATICLTSVTITIRTISNNKVEKTAIENPKVTEKPSMKVTQTIKKASKPAQAGLQAAQNPINRQSPYGKQYSGALNPEIRYIEAPGTYTQEQVDSIRSFYEEIVAGYYGKTYEEILADMEKVYNEEHPASDYTEKTTVIEYIGEKIKELYMSNVAGQKKINNLGSVGYDLNSDINVQYSRRIYKDYYLGGKLNLNKNDKCGILASVVW